MRMYLKDTQCCLLDSYLLTGEISMHLLDGFDPLIGQDTLKHKMRNYQTLKLKRFPILIRQIFYYLPFLSHPRQCQMISYPC